MTILVVDDEKDLRETLKSALESEGYDVITAENGLIGYNLAVEKRPDLVLLDISMPVMDGFTTLFRLKQNIITKDIPVIILTGQYADEENLERGFNLGATEYLYKPIKFTELIARVKSVLRMKNIENEMKKIQLQTENFFLNEIIKLFSPFESAISLLLDRGELAEDVKSLLLENYANFRNGLKLFENFMKLNRIIAGVDKFNITTFDIGEIVKKTALETKDKFAMRKIVNLNANLSRGNYISADIEWIKVGFKTFFEAIFEASSSIGEISVYDSVRAGKDGKLVLITITDSAEKLPREITKLFFNPYLLLELNINPPYNLLALKIFHLAITSNGGMINIEPGETNSGNKFVIGFKAI